MVLLEELDCSVCYQPYSRGERVPRLLHCGHTFCVPCLEQVAVAVSGFLTVRCPLCRQTTCLNRGLALPEGLWVNERLWDRIPAVREVEEEEEEEDVKREEEVRRGASCTILEQTQNPSPTSKHSRPRLRLPAFLRRLSWSRPAQTERIVPGCSVEIKSWRRLTIEETF